jgi:hypothetical protein
LLHRKIIQQANIKKEIHYVLFKLISDFFKRITGNSNQTTSTTTNQTDQTNQTEGVSMKKTALCIGINDYPGTQNDLSGCINDFNDWVDLLTAYGFTNIIKLINAQATKEAIKANLTKIVNEAVSDDEIACTYSGHGSYVVDMSKDEPESKDETIYTYNGNMLDDEIREILSKAKPGVKITVILDSCHSGTATRLMGPNAPKPRFMPPKDPEMAKLGLTLPTKKATYPESDMKEILLSGAKSTEYSYDASFGGRPNGALTRVAIDALKKLKNPTYNEWYAEIRKNLPSNEYPQTPQLEGSDENKNRKVFS